MQDQLCFFHLTWYNLVDILGSVNRLPRTPVLLRSFQMHAETEASNYL